jgi:hypothetical protein
MTGMKHLLNLSGVLYTLVFMVRQPHEQSTGLGRMSQQGKYMLVVLRNLSEHHRDCNV